MHPAGAGTRPPDERTAHWKRLRRVPDEAAKNPSITWPASWKTRLGRWRIESAPTPSAAPRTARSRQPAHARAPRAQRTAALARSFPSAAADGAAPAEAGSMFGHARQLGEHTPQRAHSDPPAAFGAAHLDTARKNDTEWRPLERSCACPSWIEIRGMHRQNLGAIRQTSTIVRARKRNFSASVSDRHAGILATCERRACSTCRARAQTRAPAVEHAVATTLMNGDTMMVRAACRSSSADNLDPASRCCSTNRRPHPPDVTARRPPRRRRGVLSSRVRRLRPHHHSSENGCSTGRSAIASQGLFVPGGLAA